MNLLLIHGRSQGGKDPKELQTEWLEALDKGFRKSKLKMPAGVNVLFPFYANVLDGFVARFDVPTGADVSAKGGAMDNDYAQFRAAVAEEIRKKAKISIEQVKKEAGKEVAPRTARGRASVSFSCAKVGRSPAWCARTSARAWSRGVAPNSGAR